MRSSRPLKVLCLDSDGGKGGSSFSLYHCLTALTKEECLPEVWCRRETDLAKAYREQGIRCRTMPDMPKVSPLPQISRDIIDHVVFFRDFCRAKTLWEALCSEESAFDLIHLNHENLVFSAWKIRKKLDLPISAHIRTMASSYKKSSAHLHARILAANIDGLIYISDNEKRAFERHSIPPKSEIILNPAPAAQSNLLRVADGNQCRKNFTVLCVSNYSWLRGNDRVVEIAAEVRNICPTAKIKFRVLGENVITGGGSDILRNLARRKATLQDFAGIMGVGHLLECPGHVSNVAEELTEADVLIKPTREDNPWGRDIIEAMAAGLPVISVGTDPLFVETGVTGLLQSEFDARKVAQQILDWSHKRQTLKQLSRNAKARVAELCNSRNQALKTLNFWQSVAKEHQVQRSSGNT